MSSVHVTSASTSHSSSSNAPAVINETMIRDDTFYCDELVLLVENTLFKVPRRLFEESPIFNDMFAVPQAPDFPVDGSSDMLPLRLDGVSAQDFKCLLHYLFPIPARPPLSADAWISVLRLSTMWSFARPRHDSIDALNNLIKTPEQRISLSREYDIPSWLVPALDSLVRRERPLSANDVTHLGLEWALKVAALREKYGHCIQTLHAEANQQIISMRSTQDRLTYSRGAPPRGFFDGIVPEPVQERATLKSAPRLTKNVIEEEFGLIGHGVEDAM